MSREDNGRSKPNGEFPSSKRRQTSKTSDEIGRREVMKTVGSIAAVTYAGIHTAAASETATNGYGEAGYGEGGYGGSTDGDSVPHVSTGDATDVSPTGAILIGELLDAGGADETACFFEWRESGADEWTATAPTYLESPDQFTRELGSLESGVEYEFRAAAETGAGVDRGGTRTFVTGEEEDESPAKPTIDYLEVSDRSNPRWARARVEWEVSGDAELERCLSELRIDGERVDDERSSLNGTSDRGRHDVRHRSSRGGTYEVVFTVVDASGGETTKRELVHPA